MPHTVHNFEFKVQSCSVGMCTNKENGVADEEAIVIEWAVSNASSDFEVVKKGWGHALLSVKCCCLCANRREGVSPARLKNSKLS